VASVVLIMGLGSLGIVCALNVLRERRLRRATLQHESLPLNSREMVIADLMSEGLSNREIERRLGIAGDPVARHVSSVVRKLGAKSREEAATQWRTRRASAERDPEPPA
jgi:DNA-binding NarL/FixJ family response regulator